MRIWINNSKNCIALLFSLILDHDNMEFVIKIGITWVKSYYN